jgi:nicotinic acid mononucleotide adenylyltransferase
MDLENLKCNNEELTELLEILIKSKAPYKKKMATLEKYSIAAGAVNFNEIVIMGAEHMEGFDERFSDVEALHTRVKFLCASENYDEELDTGYLWIQYPDGNEDRLIDLADKLLEVVE